MTNDSRQPAWEERVEAIQRGLELLGFKREDYRKRPTMTQTEFREWADGLQAKVAKVLVDAKGCDGQFES